MLMSEFAPNPGSPKAAGAAGGRRRRILGQEELKSLLASSTLKMQELIVSREERECFLQQRRVILSSETEFLCFSLMPACAQEIGGLSVPAEYLMGQGGLLGQDLGTDMGFDEDAFEEAAAEEARARSREKGNLEVCLSGTTAEETTESRCGFGESIIRFL